ncbi:hypothetical protein PRIPAC_77465, partial [Pristionchus pacificus]
GFFNGFVHSSSSSYRFHRDFFCERTVWMGSPWWMGRRGSPWWMGRRMGRRPSRRKGRTSWSSRIDHEEIRKSSFILN